MQRSYGWTEDRYDDRDLYLSLPPSPLPVKPLPASRTLRRAMPVNYDQGQLGSCTGNAGAALVEHALRRQGLHVFTPSRLALYYGARVIEGTVARDAGAQMRDVLKVIGTVGAAPETLWPYDPARFADAPGPDVVSAAKAHVATRYLSVPQTAEALKSVLAGGMPVAFGFHAFEELESVEVARTGRLPMPTGKTRWIGGHAVVLIGYDDRRELFEVRNSWGAGWGVNGGQFSMPYGYVLNPKLARDFWVIEAVSG